MNPSTARLTARSLEPIHAMVYFAPDPQEEYLALGLDGKANPAHGYFPARAAAMGAVTWPTVQAIFFNFSAFAVQLGIDGVWDVVAPADLIQARFRGAGRALTRLGGPLVEDLSEAVGLLRTATEACTPYGRPLYAAQAALDWPSDETVQLWHALSLLREYRGDGHIATLVGAGLTGLEAAVLHVAVGDSWNRKGLQSTRAYSDAEWDGAIVSLADRGWLFADGTFTPAGRERREAIEAQTDVLGLAPWAHLGEAGCARLRELLSPLARACAASFALGAPTP